MPIVKAQGSCLAESSTSWISLCFLWSRFGLNVFPLDWSVNLKDVSGNFWRHFLCWVPRGHPRWLLLPFLLSSLLCVCPSSLSAHPGSWLKTAISIFIPQPDLAHELDTQVYHPPQTVSKEHLSKIKLLLSLKLSLPQCSPPQVRATLDCRLPGSFSVLLSLSPGRATSSLQ